MAAVGGLREESQRSLNPPLFQRLDKLLSDEPGRPEDNAPIVTGPWFDLFGTPRFSAWISAGAEPNGAVLLEKLRKLRFGYTEVRSASDCQTSLPPT